MPVILSDENIPLAAEALGGIGQVRLAPGRLIDRAQLADADALAIRSVTRVGPALLAGTPVRVVASATAGMDHVDIDGLRRAGIAVASAEGSNARSVAEYIVAALLELEQTFGALEGRVLGVVGQGRIGSQVMALGRALGLRPVACDHPLARAGGKDVFGQPFLPLDELLRSSDVVTLHVPLNREGRDATLGMMDAAEFGAMKPGAWFLNASRGEVVREQALLAAPLGAFVLDVWESEPGISQETLARAFLATPHIAGYSFDGKIAGTVMVAQAIAQALGVPFAWQPDLPPAGGDPIDGREPLIAAVRRAYDIRADDRALRTPPSGRDAAAHFDHLRKHYPKRREFAAHQVANPTPLHVQLGFRGVPPA